VPVKVKTPSKAGGKKAKDPIPAGPGAIAAGGPSSGGSDKEGFAKVGHNIILYTSDWILLALDRRRSRAIQPLASTMPSIFWTSSLPRWTRLASDNKLLGLKSTPRYETKNILYLLCD
jgi:hypothetical protein